MQERGTERVTAWVTGNAVSPVALTVTRGLRTLRLSLSPCSQLIRATDMIRVLFTLWLFFGWCWCSDPLITYALTSAHEIVPQVAAARCKVVRSHKSVI